MTDLRQLYSCGRIAGAFPVQMANGFLGSAIGGCGRRRQDARKPC